MIPQLQPRVLMCRPEHFAVTYAINPWMDPVRWAAEDRALSATSRQEWERLYRTLLRLGAGIELVAPAPGVPDLVFTANAAVVMDGKALLARFRHSERRREEPHFERAFRWLRARGYLNAAVQLPPGLVLEGAGDCVWDRTRRLFWMGYGPRSDAAAARAVEEAFGIEAVSLELADPRFYHMDTALCPLTRGDVLYVPSAFTVAGLGAINERVAPELRIELDGEDAVKLAANAVCLGDTVVLSECGVGLEWLLAERGYRVMKTPLASFLRSGGSAFCLTLRLDHRSDASAERGARPSEGASPAAASA
jgi:N-dimethylarginine dimethylaminohydrolase